MVGVAHRFFAVQCAGDPGRQIVGFDITLRNLRDHAQIPLADVVKRDFGVPEFRNSQSIMNESPGESQATRSDEGNLQGHKTPLLFSG
jgi:hypothetical protein